MTNDFNRKKIGSELAALRKKRGLTTRQLAELCGLDNSNISKIENGRYNVGIDILNRLCEAMNADIAIIDKEEVYGKA